MLTATHCVVGPQGMCFLWKPLEYFLFVKLSDGMDSDGGVA